MEEHNEINKGEDALGGETQLTKIDKRLNHIEELLEGIQRRSHFQWIYSTGFGGMAIGAGMVTAGASSSNTSFVLYGALVFFLGVAIMVISPRMLNK